MIKRSLVKHSSD